MPLLKSRDSIFTLGVALLAAQALAIAVVAVATQQFALALIIGAACIGVTAVFLVVLSKRIKRHNIEIAAEIEQLTRGEPQHRTALAQHNQSPVIAEALHRTAAQLSERIELLKARHSEQRIIHESMSTGMIALDLQQNVLSINRAAQQLLGVQESTTKGRLLRDAVHDPELNRFVTQALGGTKPASAEFKLVGQSGVTVHALGEPLRNGEDKPIGLLILINDVTRLRRLEALRSDFAANVSHELRTPITNIKGYVETLLEVGVGNVEQSEKFLNVIQRNTERLAFIIEDLLALARLEQPDVKGTLNRTPTPVQQIIDAVVVQFERACTEKNIYIRLDATPGLNANANAQLLEQALGNLLSNAIKYSPADTTVTIRAAVNRHNELELAVIDQGPGIAKEHLPRLFERFYRVDRARSRELGGTGLGLAIVKHIALVHGGRAEVQSEIGQGSQFRIVLPTAAINGNVGAR